MGSELRLRYVTEANFLTELYAIGSSYLQTPQKSPHIMSLQAQMMGLYPESRLNTLNEW